MSAVPEPDAARLSRADVEAQLRNLSAADWSRAESIAKGLCAGIPTLEPADLLQETMTKLLQGVRVWRPGLHPLVVLKSTMHSEASNARKRAKHGAIDHNVEVAEVVADADDDSPSAEVPAVAELTAEDMAAQRELLAAVEAAVAGDESLELLTMAWADGLRGDEAAKELGWDKKTYEAARKRLTRRLDNIERPRRDK
jgi:DNA-directed RNA polymerase specialized sigma24 family protein